MTASCRTSCRIQKSREVPDDGIWSGVGTQGRQGCPGGWGLGWVWPATDERRARRCACLLAPKWRRDRTTEDVLLRRDVRCFSQQHDPEIVKVTKRRKIKLVSSIDYL